MSEEVVVEMFEPRAADIEGVHQPSELGRAFDHADFDAALNEQVGAGKASDASSQDGNGFWIHKLDWGLDWAIERRLQP